MAGVCSSLALPNGRLGNIVLLLGQIGVKRQKPAFLS